MKRGRARPAIPIGRGPLSRVTQFVGRTPDGFPLVKAGVLTIPGVTKRSTVPVHVIGARAMAGIGDFAGFGTTFTIDRQDYGVLGTRWSGNSMAIDPPASQFI